MRLRLLLVAVVGHSVLLAAPVGAAVGSAAAGQGRPVGAPVGALAGLLAGGRAGTSVPAARPVTRPARPSVARPLAGRTIVLDAGHQLGNARFPRQIGAPVDAGGFTKPCNTTGTATDAGYPEATFAWGVVSRARDALRRLGATVLLTRTGNDADAWGPCVDVRGRFGNAGYRGRTADADLKLSVHGDGSAPGNHGFHVILAAHGPARAASMAYALDTRAALQRAGFARSTYVGGGSALSVRGDLATLNLADMPSVMVELGNMRNAGDAAVMTSPGGQRRYADALVGRRTHRPGEVGPPGRGSGPDVHPGCGVSTSLAGARCSTAGVGSPVVAHPGGVAGGRSPGWGRRWSSKAPWRLTSRPPVGGVIVGGITGGRARRPGA